MTDIEKLFYYVVDRNMCLDMYTTIRLDLENIERSWKKRDIIPVWIENDIKELKKLKQFLKKYYQDHNWHK